MEAYWLDSFYRIAFLHHAIIFVVAMTVLFVENIKTHVSLKVYQVDQFHVNFGPVG